MAIEAFRSAQQWKQRMNVIVLKVVSPTRFLIRESSGPAMSPSVREFISLEAEMIHYRTKCDLEPFTSLLPQLGSIVLVQNRSLKKWYRGRVNNVFDTISGYQVEVFLVDYGKTLLVDRRDLHKVPNKRILEVPFQCIEFLLLGVGPLRLTIDPATITAIYVRGSSWDTASIDHVNSRVQKADAVHIEVLGKTTSGGLCGKLFIDCNKNVIALDKELVKLNYAFLDAAAGMEEVILDDYKPEKDDQQPVKESQDEDTSKSSNFWDDIQRKSASAALKEVLDSVYGTSSSSLALVPLEVCEAEESPPSSGSASGECSPLHWSSSSTSISIDTSSSGTDTPPTLPGLGRGLSLMLRVKEFASDSSCCEPSARGSIDMQTGELSTAMLSPSEYSDEDECYTPTLVGTPPAVFRDRETAYSPEKLQSSSSEPAMPQLETVQSRHEPSSVIPKPVMPQSLADTSHSDECRARGRARLLSLSPNPSNSSEKSRVAFRRSVTLSERFSMSSEASSGSSAPEACAADKKNPSPVMNLPDFTAYRGRGRALFTKVMSGHKDMQTEKLSTAMLSPGEDSDEDACYTPTPVGTPPAVFRERETVYSPEKLQSSSSEPAMPQLETVQSRHEPSSVIPKPVMPQSLADTSHFDECRARGRARLLSLSPNPSSSSEKSRVAFRRSVTLSERFSMSSEASSGSSAPEACAADKKNPSPVMNLPDFTAYRGRGHALFTKVMSGRIPGQSTTQLSPQPLSTQKNSLAQEESFDISCGSNQPKPASSSVQNDTYPSKVITKATRMKDLWGKKGHSLCAASLQGCSSKAQDDSLANFLKPDVTAGTVPALKKEDLFTGTSLSCPGSSTDQMPASTMSSRELVAKFLDASNLKTSYEPDQEFADPCATMGVSQSSEDFWRTDVFSELSADLDPCAQFQSPIYFKTGHDTSRQASQPAFSEVRVLCHGIRPPRPQTHLDQTVFDQFVKSRLRSEGFQDPTCIQTVVWPAVMSGRDIVAVGPRNSGKTLAYLIPLVSRLMSEIDYEKLPAGVGPLMVVLASTWEGALRIYHQAKQLVHEKRGPKICALYPGGAVKGKEVEVVNGCDVLVTTPLCFLRFLTNYGRLIVNLRRCCHVVLDDGERLLDKFAVEVTSVMNEFRQCLKRRKPGMLRGQIIVCSTMWSSGLNWFIRMTSLSQNPLIVFTSFFEAAIYAQVPTVASYVHPNSRQETLLRIVEGSLGRKVVVCTADKESAISLQRLLLSTSINCLLLYDELPMAKIWEITDEWNSVRPRTVLPVLVAQDNVLSLASIRDAAVLIHYDVPELSKYNFGFRFSVLADRMRSFMDEGALYTADEPVAHLILSSGNRSLSVQLVDFLGRLGTNVPDGLARLALEEQAKASSNLNVALCRNLKAFGHCENQTMTGEKGCYYRHKVLLAADHTRVWEDLPSQGLVLIVVTKVVNATCFYAWILQHWDTSSNSTNERKFVVKENLELHNAMLSLNDFFMKPGNFKYVDSNVVPKVGEVYGLEHTVGHFRRVLVLSITPKKSAPASITVFHMDYGDKSTVAARRLLHLPRELANLRPFIMEVFCCRIQPQDCDLDWTFQANHKSYELVLRKELLGKIVLRLGNTLWLDPLVLWESLPFVDAKVPLQNVRSTLIEANLACNNATHLESLRNMAAEAGVLLPNLSEMNKERSEDDSANTVVNQHCTAFLDMKDFNHVYLWKVTSPSDFYIQPLKFNSCLDELENNIQKTMKRRELRKLRSCHPGALCIAHYNNDGWYRGEVQEVLNSSEVNVFFPDYGDTARCPRDELFKPLSWMMLLPYQGIQCSLAGIVSPSGNWSPMAQSVLESFGYDDYDVNRVLCLRVVKKNAGKHPWTNCYEVLLFSGCYKERISAADLLVEQGLAVSTKLPKLSFDVNLAHSTVSLEATGAYDSESDEDGEEVTLECQRKLEEHMYNVFSEVRDQVLAPAAEFMQELSYERDALGQGDTCQPQAKESEAQPPQQSCIQSDKKATEKRVKPANAHLRALRKECPLLESHLKAEQSRQASISWWQDHSFVYVNILIANVKEYKLDVTAKMFCIRAETAQHEYLAHERLYAPIVPKKTSLVVKADSLGIIFEKIKKKHIWKFLTRNQRKVWHIRYDLDHVDVSDDENDVVKACKAFKDPLFTGGYECPAEILPYDPVAHEERAREIEADVEDFGNSDVNMYFSVDPNDIFSDFTE